MANTMPAADWAIDEALVRTLLGEQFPGLAELPIRPLASGWDNEMYRLGDDLVVRLPRRRQAVPLIVHEQQLLAVLAPRLPLPIPVPVAAGIPSPAFPMPWSVTPWFDGELAADAVLADGRREAERLAEFLVALHTEAPDDAPDNEFRGQDVRTLATRVAANLERLVGSPTLVAAVTERFERWSAVARHAGPPCWLHGDLHAANVVVRDGAIAAVIDFGDVTGGDPAVDLAIGWMLFDEPARAVFRASLHHVDDACWTRGMAWALHFAVVYLAHSADNARMESIGRRLLDTMLDATVAA